MKVQIELKKNLINFKYKLKFYTYYTNYFNINKIKLDIKLILRYITSGEIFFIKFKYFKINFKTFYINLKDYIRNIKFKINLKTNNYVIKL